MGWSICIIVFVLRPFLLTYGEKIEGIALGFVILALLSQGSGSPGVLSMCKLSFTFPLESSLTFNGEQRV